MATNNDIWNGNEACRIATLAEPRDEHSVAAMNTDREIWRREADYYSPSIHVTAAGGIGMNVGCRVIVMSVEEWHQLAVGGQPSPANRRK